MLNHILIAILSGGLIIFGAIGSILPILPGPQLSFGGFWLYAWYTGYETITPTVVVVFAVLTLLTFVTDVIAPALGAKGYKASRAGVVGSFIGAFGGIFIMGPIGIIIGPFLGAFLGELWNARDYTRATRVAWGSFVGFMLGSVFKLAVIVGMLVYFVYALFS